MIILQREPAEHLRAEREGDTSDMMIDVPSPCIAVSTVSLYPADTLHALHGNGTQAAPGRLVTRLYTDGMPRLSSRWMKSRSHPGLFMNTLIRFD